MDTLQTSDILKEEHLLFNNLLILGLNLSELKSNFNLDYQINTFSTERKNNYKIIAVILHFLLDILTEGESNPSLKPYFPIRTPTDYLDFKKIAFIFLQNLEKEGKIPKNFILSSAIFDEFSGLALINTLRFLSEFAIIFTLSIKYPSEKIEAFYLTSFRGNDISSQYEVNSLMSEKAIETKLKNSHQISTVIKGCQLSLHIQRKRFFKLWNQFNENTEIWSSIAQSFTEKYLKYQKLNSELLSENQKLAEIIPKNFLSEFRALDRMPYIDLSRAFFAEINEIGFTAKQNDTIEKIDNFYQDSKESNVLDKITKERLGIVGEQSQLIQLDQVYKKWNDCLEKSQETIPDEEQVQKILSGLKEINGRIEKNKEELRKYREIYTENKNKLIF